MCLKVSFEESFYMNCQKTSNVWSCVFKSFLFFVMKETGIWQKWFFVSILWEYRSWTGRKAGSTFSCLPLQYNYCIKDHCLLVFRGFYKLPYASFLESLFEIINSAGVNQTTECYIKQVFSNILKFTYNYQYDCCGITHTVLGTFT